MKVCVCSDSHGRSERLIEVLNREQPELCFFLGDGARDLEAARTQFPRLVFYAVRGNCDLRSRLPQELVCAVGGVTVFVAHGHRYEVKHDHSLRALRRAAREADADVVLFGHTHLPALERHAVVLFLNPGSLGGVRRSYGVLTLEDGRVRAELKSLCEGE